MVKTKFLAILLVLCALLSLFVGCGGEQEVEPGTYFFDMDSYGAFIEIESSGFEKKTSGSVQTYVDATFKTKAKPYNNWDKKEFYFDGCKIVLEVNINGDIYTCTAKLAENGDCELPIDFPISPAYETDVSYKIVDVSGVVVAPIHALAEFSYNGFTYIYKFDDNYNDYVCYLSHGRYDRDYETLYFTDFVTNPDGKRIRFVPDHLWIRERDGQITTMFADFRPNHAVKNIIFDGDFNIEDFDFVAYIGKSLKDFFPNLENFVMGRLHARTENPRFEGMPTFPESGVNVYVDDYTGVFKSALSNVYFVNGIYSFSEFDISEYRK